jgi:molybdopterin molybdotransferase
MADMVPLETALERMVAAVEPLAPRALPLLDADGCVLAKDCIATRTKPPFAVSAMDGYALARMPTAGEQLTIIGEVPAGAHFAGTVGTGETVRIFTGAPIPDGATHVLIQEDADRTGDTIRVSDNPEDGPNIRPAGGDFIKGETLIAKGTHLTPQHLALAASGNHADLLVHPKPSITVMMNGDELAWPGKDAPEDAIIASNGYAMATLAQRFGANLYDLTLIRDDQQELEAYIGQCEAECARYDRRGLCWRLRSHPSSAGGPRLRARCPQSGTAAWQTDPLWPQRNQDRTWPARQPGVVDSERDAVPAASD